MFKINKDSETEEQSYTNDINPKSYYGLSLDKTLINDKRQEKWQKERFEKGFDDTEIWSLDSTIIKFIVPRLKAYLEEDKKLRNYENNNFSFEEKKKYLK